MNLRVATYNIHRAIGRDGRDDPSRIARVLGELDADVIALQEVGDHGRTPGTVLDVLRAETGSSVIEGVTLRDARGPFGNAVLTRVPVTRFRLHDISRPGREPRGAIELFLDLDGVTVQVIATHLGLRPGERRHQVAAVLALLDGSGADIRVLVGDLNEWLPFGRPLRRLRAAFGPLPAPATFPAHRRWFALDRIWVRPSANVVAIDAHDTMTSRVASDHLPLVADLDLALARRERSREISAPALPSDAR